MTPSPRMLLDGGARLPPVLRSRLSVRLFSALARRVESDNSLCTTNLGIERTLQCLVPTSQFHARFGKPSLYAGERGALELAARLCRDADAFLDVGAHLGFFTFYVRARGSATVPIHFFEPDPQLFALLEANVRANRLAGVDGHQVALGAYDGLTRFYVNDSDSFSGSLTEMFAERHVVHPIEVGVRSFVSFASERRLSRVCLKVDVENAEWDFLDGAAGAFDRISYLVMEVLGPAHSSGFVSTLIERTGFNAYYINDYRLEHSPDGTFEYRAPEYNWLFCRDSPTQLSALLAGTRITVSRR